MHYLWRDPCFVSHLPTLTAMQVHYRFILKFDYESEALHPHAFGILRQLLNRPPRANHSCVFRFCLKWTTQSNLPKFSFIGDCACAHCQSSMIVAVCSRETLPHIISAKEDITGRWYLKTPLSRGGRA